MADQQEHQPYSIISAAPPAPRLDALKQRLLSNYCKLLAAIATGNCEHQKLLACTRPAGSMLRRCGPAATALPLSGPPPLAAARGGTTSPAAAAGAGEPHECNRAAVLCCAPGGTPSPTATVRSTDSTRQRVIGACQLQRARLPLAGKRAAVLCCAQAGGQPGSPIQC